jgi:hypothetical protein
LHSKFLELRAYPRGFCKNFAKQLMDNKTVEGRAMLGKFLHEPPMKKVTLTKAPLSPPRSV